ncbi:indolepyruvate oxidoreductase subunit beta [Acidobacteriota bacterium]
MMGQKALGNDPYNIVIAGVGGQGNVLASRILGNMMSRRDLCVTIGETFGASQRGGSVMSHLRISSETSWSPQIPKGRAHMVVALEPIEAIRVLRDYGNPDTKALCNSRPIHPVGVIAGDLDYPPIQELKTWIRELSGTFWFVDATDVALELGDPVLGNVVMLGALAEVGELPILREDFEAVILENLPTAKVDINLSAFDQGVKLARN